MSVCVCWLKFVDCRIRFNARSFKWSFTVYPFGVCLVMQRVANLSKSFSHKFRIYYYWSIEFASLPPCHIATHSLTFKTTQLPSHCSTFRTPTHTHPQTRLYLNKLYLQPIGISIRTVCVCVCALCGWCGVSYLHICSLHLNHHNKLHKLYYICTLIESSSAMLLLSGNERYRWWSVWWKTIWKILMCFLPTHWMTNCIGNGVSFVLGQCLFLITTCNWNTIRFECCWAIDLQLNWSSLPYATVSVAPRVHTELS